jgi:hypothetical protein
MANGISPSPIEPRFCGGLFADSLRSGSEDDTISMQAL